MSQVIFPNSRRLKSLFGAFKVSATVRWSGLVSPVHSRSHASQNARIMQPESYDEGTWLHKMDDTQKMFVYGHRNGTRFGLLLLTLNSRKPLSPDVLHQAMLHWHRKTPVFQVVMREYNDDMWFYRPKNVDIDFKVCKEGTPRQDIIDECFSGFDEANGPLWMARLLQQEKDAPCLDPEAKKDYPHQYNLLVSTHHSVADGRTLLGLVQPVVDIINDVIEGTEVDNSPIGVFVSNDEYREAYSLIRKKLVQSPERLEKLRDFVLKSNKSPLLLKCFPRPDVANPTTKHLFVDLNQEKIVRFQRKCKEMGISGGTGLQTITNTALVELAQEAGATDELYDLSANFTIDLRRYMQPRELLIHGCHAHTMASFTTLDKNVRDNFWSNCQAVHKVNVDLIKGGKVVKQAIGRQLFLAQPPAEEFFNTFPEVTRDYAFNNLRAVDRLIHGKGKHVQLTDMTGFNAIQKFIFPFMQMIYEYRGCHKCLLSYTTDWLTEENTVMIADRIASLLEYYSEK